jgi:hypothetical protein
MALRLVVDAPTRLVSDRYEEWTVPVDMGPRWDWTPICHAGSDVDVDVDGGMV